MKTLLILPLLFAPTLALAVGDPGGPSRGPRCDGAALSACISANQGAALAARAQASQLAPQLDALNTAIAALAQRLGPAQAQATTLSAELQSLQAEAAFLAGPAEPAAPKILPGFPAVEDVFSLSGLAKNWLERYPLLRAQAIADETNRNQALLQQTQQQVAELQAEMVAESGARDEEKSQQTDLIAAALQHDGMCAGGCQAAYCSSGN